MGIAFGELHCSSFERNLFSETLINLYWNRLCSTYNSLIVIVCDSEKSVEIKREVHSLCNVINASRCFSFKEI
jgi:hypothetical protein